jgi:hypothetical protein
MKGKTYSLRTEFEVLVKSMVVLFAVSELGSHERNSC